MQFNCVHSVRLTHSPKVGWVYASSHADGQGEGDWEIYNRLSSTHHRQKDTESNAHIHTHTAYALGLLAGLQRVQLSSVVLRHSAVVEQVVKSRMAIAWIS